jgi:hypothetical protein
VNRKPSRLVPSICLLVAAPAAILLFAACGVRPTVAPAVARTEQPSLFATESECAPCHADIVRSHARSRHATSLHFVSAFTPHIPLPPSGPVGKTRYSVQHNGDKLVFENASSAEKRRDVDLAFGSGKIGITYVALNGDNTIEEMRMSFVPRLKRWYVTPGQEDLWDDDLGHVHGADAARACLGCHTSTLPAETLRPEPQFLGIGCQACHGPASAHVAAAKSGHLQDLRIDRASQWAPAKVNEVCGKCHRSPANVSTTGNEITMTQRFQAYGLEQSPCYEKSGGKLSCVTCHNPHANVTTDTRSYEVVCLQCHSGARPAAATPSAVQSKVCPVNPDRKCIGCHMPDRQVFPRSGIVVPMADHLIWAYRDKSHKAGN